MKRIYTLGIIGLLALAALIGNRLSAIEGSDAGALQHRLEELNAAERVTAPLASSSAQEVSAAPAKNSALVKRVIDGDTIELASGEKVRYIGIDTPEVVDPRKPVECFGHEASDKNKELVEGKIVRLEKDIRERDKYGRLLRYVWAGDVFINLRLVRLGYALASTYPPDVQYSSEFRAAEAEARAARQGLWGSCPPPQEHM